MGQGKWEKKNWEDVGVITIIEKWTRDDRHNEQAICQNHELNLVLHSSWSFLSCLASAPNRTTLAAVLR